MPQSWQSRASGRGLQFPIDIGASPVFRTGLPGIENCQRVLIDPGPAGFAIEPRAQCPISRQERQFESVALQCLSPSILRRHEFAVIAADRRTEEIAAPIEEDPLTR